MFKNKTKNKLRYKFYGLGKKKIIPVSKKLLRCITPTTFRCPFGCIDNYIYLLRNTKSQDPDEVFQECKKGYT